MKRAHAPSFKLHACIPNQIIYMHECSGIRTFRPRGNSLMRPSKGEIMKHWKGTHLMLID